jgi:hypothetical protein
MKKITLISLLVFLLSVFSITQASAGYRIVWSGNSSGGPVSTSGSIPTNETSRTQQATYEAYMAILSNSNGLCNLYQQPSWSGSCYYRSYDEDYGFYYISCSSSACLDGTWGFSNEVSGGGPQCYTSPTGPCKSGSGTWDVVYVTTTTTTQQTTTTTTAPATLIKLSSFTAIPKFSQVIIQWSTESEIDNAGFNIYRATAEDGEYTKINSAFIAAEGSTTQGANYEFIDSGLRNGKTYYYKLEDIDLNGGNTLHGPVNATPRWVWGLFQKFNKTISVN